jgi:hypothetical protein
MAWYTQKTIHVGAGSLNLEIGTWCAIHDKTQNT